MKPEDCTAFEEAVRAVEAELQNEQKVGDPDLVIKINKVGEKQAMVLDRSSKTQVLTMLVLLPNGVQAMSMSLENLVETSLNLGIMNLKEDELSLSSSVRSSVESSKQFLIEKLTVLTEYVGGSVGIRGNYPGWEFQPESYIRDVFCKAYKDLTGKEPKVEALHAGLECGLFSGKVPGLDCISLGPDMSGVHTTEERLSISSTQRVWELLVEVLKRLK